MSDHVEILTPKIPTPKVSVVGMCYNHVKYARETVQSVLEQKGVDFEFVLVDDCSTDGTADYLRTLDDPRMRIILHTKNQGVCRTGNRAFAHTRGEYLAVVSCDDVWVPHRLVLQTRYLDEHPDVGAVVGKLIVIDGDGNEINHGPLLDLNVARSRTELLRRSFLGTNSMAAIAEMVRRSALDPKRPFYDIRLKQTQDWASHVPVLQHWNIAMLPRPVVRYRWHDANLSKMDDPAALRRLHAEYLLILDLFLEFRDPDLILRMLPECSAYGTVTEKSIPYFLARVALDSGDARRTIWGLKVLDSLMAGDAYARYLEETMGFSLHEYYELRGSVEMQACRWIKKAKSAAGE